MERPRQMPITAALADAVTRKIPPLVSRKTHRRADYLIAGSFLLGSAFFWRRNRRAALAAALCGGAGLGAAVLTDYSGRQGKPIAWRNHRNIDLGLAAMAGTIPGLMAFGPGPERSLFTTGAIAITVLTNLTSFTNRGWGEYRRPRAGQRFSNS
jgi:hypothetical protein